MDEKRRRIGLYPGDGISGRACRRQQGCDDKKRKKTVFSVVSLFITCGCVELAQAGASCPDC